MRDGAVVGGRKLRQLWKTFERPTFMADGAVSDFRLTGLRALAEIAFAALRRDFEGGAGSKAAPHGIRGYDAFAKRARNIFAHRGGHIAPQGLVLARTRVVAPSGHRQLPRSSTSRRALT